MFLFHIITLIILEISASETQNSKLRTYSGGRIIGGSQASAAQFPFVAAVNVQTSNSIFFCGGALISHQHVLTAGHCVDGAVLFTVHLGSTSLSEEDENRLTVATSEYVLHPDYNSRTLENDIGVIHLRMSIRFTDYISSIYLPYQYIDGGQYVTALGWGQVNDSDSEYSDHLQFVSVRTMIQGICEFIYGEDVIAESMVCVEGSYNEGTCVGDSGGPLIQYINSSSTVWHVGVASFISENGCESTDPSGFTRTFSFREWLRNITNV